MTCTTRRTIQQETKTKNFPTIIAHNNIPAEINTWKRLNISPNLSPSQTKQLLKEIQNEKETFAWECTDMKGIHLDLCTHHICIRDECRRVFQPQRIMNLSLKNIVKEELQKLLDVGFIYPISNSQWVSPLSIDPNNK